MTKLKLIQINDADYGDDRVLIEAQHWYRDGLDWAVPAWEEMGLGELEGVFATRAVANAALASVPTELLAEYGYRVAPQLFA